MDGKVKFRPRQSRTAFLGAALVVLALAACSTTKAPTDALSRAESGIRAAREAGANETASLDLKRAAEKLARARQALAADRYDQARRFAESAQVDAELAEARAEMEIVRRAADDLQRRVDTVQTDAERESRKPLTPKPGQD